MPSQIPQALEPDQLDVIVGKGNVDPPWKVVLGIKLCASSFSIGQFT